MKLIEAAPAREAKTTVTVTSEDIVLEITIAARLRGDPPDDKPLIVLK